MRKVSKKVRVNRLLTVTFLVLLAFCLNGCKDKEDVESLDFNPSLPVEVNDFTPKEGGVGQKLVIYGKNFGNDPKLVKVKIGGKDATVINVRGNSLYPKIRRIKKMSSLPKFWLQNTKMVRNTL